MEEDPLCDEDLIQAADQCVAIAPEISEEGLLIDDSFDDITDSQLLDACDFESRDFGDLESVWKTILLYIWIVALIFMVRTDICTKEKMKGAMVSKWALSPDALLGKEFCLWESLRTLPIGVMYLYLCAFTAMPMEFDVFFK